MSALTERTPGFLEIEGVDASDLKEKEKAGTKMR